MRARLLLATFAALAACASSSPPPAPAPAAAATEGTRTEVRRIAISDSFTPRTDKASIDAFRAEVAPEESGGECSIMRTGGNGATIATAFFPARIGKPTSMSITFDSAGHVVRFTDRRSDRASDPVTGMRAEQADSLLRAQIATRRSTSVSFDYVIDQGIASNAGGGRPTTAILSSVRALERLESLGPPVARMARLRRLCGV